MKKTKDNIVDANDLFTSVSRDFTPQSQQHAVRLLYAPVSHDEEVTRRCAAVLSDTELERSDRFATQENQSLFMQRRAFRRYCGALALGGAQPLAQIEFLDRANAPPRLIGLPRYCFSFSSCRFGFVGAWSATHNVGVDIEDTTRSLEATELAMQFFSGAEVAAVQRPGGRASSRTFYQFWSLKEAALKSIGEGLPFGLDAFEFGLEPTVEIIQAPAEYGGQEQFNAHLINRTSDNIALVVHSPTH